MSSDKSTLAQKILGSLRRDRGLPLPELVAKVVRYGTATAVAPFYLRDCDVVGANARTSGGAPIVDNRGRLVVGDRVQIISRFVPVRFVVAPGATLEIGDGVLINYGAVISAEQRVVMGHRISVGPHVHIADHDEASDLHGGAPDEVHIGDDVWLAARVRVMKGARIGAGTVVAAGSVVSGVIPPGVVVAGVPARVLRKRNPDEAPEHVEHAPESGATPKVDAMGLLVSDFSIQELAQHLRRTDELGLTVDAVTAPFDQVMQTLHQLDALAKDAGAEFAVVWTRPESIAGYATRAQGGKVGQDAILAEVDAYAELVLRAARELRYAFVPTWTLAPFDRGLGMLDMKPGGMANTIAQMNLRLAERLDGSNVHVLDAQRWITSTGRAAVRAKLWYLGKVGLSSAVLAEAALDLRAAIRGIKGQAKKLVVLDLDDTLWGGIVGDAGWQNLRLGGHDPVGESHADFQQHLVKLSRRGIALAIVSKNEESVAMEAFHCHPEMLLTMENVSAYRINWRDKAQNIVEIAKELNLGLQSIVFIDDNPVERARVREALPEVYVPEWPDDKLEYVPRLLSLRCFDVPRISKEDAERARMYAEERQRDGLKSDFTSLEDWLLGLGIKVRFQRLDAANVGRATQLLNKTNQMNLRTRRFTEAELSVWASDPSHEVWAVSVTDRFGDSGLTAVLGLEREGDVMTIVDYVLSCRVMGRCVEETLLWAACERALARGATRVVAPFFPTAKNKPTRTLFDGSGFLFDEATRSFTWSLDAARYPKPAAVTAEGLP